MKHLKPFDINEKLGVATFVEEFTEALRPYITEMGVKRHLDRDDYTGVWAKDGVTFIFDIEHNKIGYKMGEFKRWGDNKPDKFITDHNGTIRDMKKALTKAKMDMPKFNLVLWPTATNGAVGQQSGRETISLAMDRDEDDIDSTLMHEVNHLYQDHMGWRNTGYFSGGRKELENVEDYDIRSNILEFNRLVYLSMKNEVDARVPQAYDDLRLLGKQGLPLANADTFRRQIKVLDGWRDAMSLIKQWPIKKILGRDDDYIIKFYEIWKDLYGRRHVVGYKADSGQMEEVDIDDDEELLKRVRALKATRDERKRQKEAEEYARNNTPEMIAKRRAKTLLQAKRFVKDWSSVFTRRGKELKLKISKLYDKFVPDSVSALDKGSWLEFKYKGKPYTGKYKGKEDGYHVFNGNWDEADTLTGVTARLSGPTMRLIIKRLNR